MAERSGRDRQLDAIRKDAVWLGFWSRFGQVMAGYVLCLTVLLIFGDWSSSTIFNVTIGTLAWALIGALVSFDGASREGQKAVDRAKDHERRIRQEIAQETAAAKP